MTERYQPLSKYHRAVLNDFRGALRDAALDEAGSYAPRPDLTIHPSQPDSPLVAANEADWRKHKRRGLIMGGAIILALAGGGAMAGYTNSRGLADSVTPAEADHTPQDTARFTGNFPLVQNRSFTSPPEREEVRRVVVYLNEQLQQSGTSSVSAGPSTVDRQSG